MEKTSPENLRIARLHMMREGLRQVDSVQEVGNLLKEEEEEEEKGLSYK